MEVEVVVVVEEGVRLVFDKRAYFDVDANS